MPYKDEVREAMPKVGDRLTRTPHLHKSLSAGKPRPQACVVDYVNTDNLWYRVRFENGTRESYKAPDINVAAKGWWAHQ